MGVPCVHVLCASPCVLCALVWGSMSKLSIGMGESSSRVRASCEWARLGLVLGVYMCAGVGEGVRAVLAGVQMGDSPPSP